MRIGFVLPQVGPAANPRAIVHVAQRAEALGYDSVWVTERLRYTINPAVRTLGANELFFDATFSPGTHFENDFLRILEEIRRMI